MTFVKKTGDSGNGSLSFIYTENFKIDVRWMYDSDSEGRDGSFTI